MSRPRAAGGKVGNLAQPEKMRTGAQRAAEPAPAAMRATPLEWPAHALPPRAAAPQPPQEAAAHVTLHQDHRAYEDLIRRQRPQRRRTLSTGNDRR